MRIKSLKIKGFRNLQPNEIELCEGVNLFVGKNAQGKTNAVEAGHLLLRGKSFRSNEFRDMIAWNSEMAHVCGVVELEKGTDKIDARLTKEKKEYIKNQKRARPYGVGVIVSSPEAVSFIRGGPAERRDYVDDFICQVEPLYSPLINSYSKIISQRNKILQDDYLSPQKRISLLAPWDDQLLMKGSAIVFKRKIWAQKLNAFIPTRYSHMAPEDGTAELIYVPKSVEGDLLDEKEIYSSLIQDLEARRHDEIMRRTSLVGPHRDDFSATIGSMASKQFGSQGQKRTFMLALKMSEIDLISNAHGEVPLFILDDVKSELDERRSAYLLEYLSQVKGQALITATSDEDVLGLSTKAVFDVEHGRILPRK